MAISRAYRGFTLVELVVTLVIIGVLAAVSAPIFFTSQNFQQSGFYNEALATIHYAQKSAVASGCGVQVAIAGDTVTLTTAAGAATCFAGPFGQPVLDPSNPSPGVAFARRAPSGTTVVPSVTPFVFCPLGDISGNGTCTGNYPRAATITVDVTNQPRINIDGATGYAR